MGMAEDCEVNRSIASSPARERSHAVLSTSCSVLTGVALHCVTTATTREEDVAT